MSAAPFEDPRYKVENARHHIARVEAEFKAYVGGSPLATVQNVGLTVVNFGPRGPLPRTVPMAAGDAIHNLRSALDIMAGDVVQASGASRKGVSFPFSDSAAELEKQIKDKKFNRAAPEAIDLLRSLKPHKGGNIALRAIHDLDVTDKHQFILPVSKGTRVTNLRIDGPILRFGEVSTKLVFGRDKPLAGQEVIPTLHGLVQLTLTVIEAFAQLFTGGGRPTGGGPP